MLSLVVAACGDGGSSRTDSNAIGLSVPSAGGTLGSASVAIDEAIPVVAEKLPSDPIYGEPAGLALVGSHLWVRDLATSEPWLHVVDTTTGRVIRSLGKKGEGPGEFGEVSSIFASSVSDSAIWVWDHAEGRLTRMVATAPVGTNASTQIIKPGVAGISWVSPLGKLHFLGRRMSDLPGHFIIFSQNGVVLRTDSLRLPFGDSIPVRESRKAINGSVLCTRRDQAGFAITYPYAGRIQLYDSLATLTGTAQVPFAGAERFVHQPSNGQIAFERARLFYRTCTFSATRLFALYIGVDPKEGDPEPWFGREIHVFDLRGRLLGKLKIDVDLSTIVADSTGGRLFGLSFENTTLYRIVVPRF